MTVYVTHHVPLGDGQVQVHARTEAGNRIDVVVGYDLLESPVLYEILDRRASTVDELTAALDARKGGSEWD